MPEVNNPTPWLFEQEARERGYVLIAGVDEAGRGPLAGPVVAAAVILPQDFDIRGIKDSKKLRPLSRDDAYDRIMAGAQAVGVGVVSSEEIDRINILQATYNAMRTAIAGLSVCADCVLVDGWPIPSLAVHQKAIPHGDALSVSIAAASIIAKVTRDRMMREMDEKYPGYGFAAHKGYYTAEHVEAICRNGVCEIHRKTFAPISEMVDGSWQQRSLF